MLDSEVVNAFRLDLVFEHEQTAKLHQLRLAELILVRANIELTFDQTYNNR